MPVTGLLKGYDTLVNLVLDETKEFLRGTQPPPSTLHAPPCICHRCRSTDRCVLGHAPLRCVHALPADPTDPYKPSVRTRGLGLTVCKGSSVMLICPVDGTEEIPNPFLKSEEQI